MYTVTWFETLIAGDAVNDIDLLPLYKIITGIVLGGSG